MAIQPRPQSRWVGSFVLFSVLACVCVAALGLGTFYLGRRVIRHFRAASPGAAPVADIRPNVPLPGVTSGWDNVVANLLHAFDYVDVIALGETHGSRMESELRLRLIRNSDFPFRAHFIVVEFGNSLYQATLDRYLDGEDVPLAAVERVWQDTTQVGGGDSPVYAEFFAAVREVNRKLPADRRLRVIAGDPPVDWDRVKTKADWLPFVERRRFPVSLDRIAIPRGEKALVIYGEAHLKRPAFPLWAAAASADVEADPLAAPLPPTAPPLFKALQANGPGRVFVVTGVAGVNPFETTLDLGELPALVPLTGMHSAVGTGLGESADACIYFGDSPEAHALVQPDPAIYRGTPYGTEIARRRKIVATEP